MLRPIVGALALSLLVAGMSAAEDYKAKVKSTDKDKNVITFTVDGKDMTLPVHKECDIYSQGKGKKGQPGPKQAVDGNLGGLKVDQAVTVTTSKIDEKDMVTAIKVETPMRKKKKNP